MVVVATVVSEMANLEQQFAQLLEVVKGGDQDLTTSTLENLLLLDAAAEATQVRRHTTFDGCSAAM